MLLPDNIYKLIGELKPADMYKTVPSYCNGYQKALHDVFWLLIEQEDKIIQDMAEKEGR